MYKGRRKKLVSSLLVIAMLFTFLPVMAQEDGTAIQVEFTIDTDAIASDVAVIGQEPILDGTVTVEAAAGSSVYDVLVQASEEYGFALDAIPTWITSIGWADDTYAYDLEGYTMGGWTYWVDGKPSTNTADTEILQQDCSITWRYSVTGPDWACPTFDEYPDLDFIDARRALTATMEQAENLDDSYTQEELKKIEGLVFQGESLLAEIKKGIEDNGGAEFAYFIYLMDEGMGMNYEIQPIIEEMETLQFQLDNAIQRKVPVTGMTLNKTFVDDLEVGNTFQLIPKLEPENATVTDVVYQVDDPSIITVDENGVVTGVSDDVGIVTVTSVDNPKVVARCTFMVQPRPAATEIFLPDSIEIGLSETYTYQLTAQPANADLSGVVWSVVSGGECLTVDQAGTITPLAEGEAVVKAELGALSATSKVTVLPLEEQLGAIMEKTGQWILKERDHFQGEYDTGMDWDMFALARSGIHIPAVDRIQYVNAVYAYLNSQDGEELLASDYARIGLGLSSIGMDITNFNGMDLTEKIYQNEMVETQGINAYVFGLLLLDSKDYSIPEQALWNRQALIDEILQLQKPEGYYVIRDEWGVDNDLTAMVVQALAPYYNQPDVQAVVDKALNWLSQNQNENAGFESWGSENSQTPAQVMIALIQLGRNPLEDPMFVKNGKTLFSNLQGFLLEDGGIRFSPSEPVGNAMATQQVLYSFAALDRMLGQENLLYDLTDCPVDVDEELLMQAGQMAQQAKEKLNGNYAAQTLLELSLVIQEIEQFTQQTAISQVFDALLRLQTTQDQLKELIPIGDGNIVIGQSQTQPCAIEPLDHLTPLTIDRTETQADVYLDLSRTRENLPKVSAKNNIITLTWEEGNKLTGGDPLFGLLKSLPLEESVKDNINGLLLDTNTEVQNLYARVGFDSKEPAQFEQYVTIRFQDLGTSQGVEMVNGEYRQIGKFATSEAGEESGRDTYCYRDGQDLVIRTKQLSEFVIYSIQDSTGQGGGSQVDRVTLTVSAETVDKGKLVSGKAVSIGENDTPYTVLQRTISDSKLKYTGSGKTIYITGIKFNDGWINEFDYGSESGWMFSVNGQFPGIACNTVTLQKGDVVEWVYTGNLGEDVGDSQKPNKPNGGTGGNGGTTTVSPSPDPAEPTPEPTPEPTQRPDFADLDSASDWAVPFIRQAQELEIVVGNENNEIEPQKALTRAEFVVMLLREMGQSQSAEYEPIFQDVAEDDWFASDVLNAYRAGIIKGKEADRFAPEETLTREEMATILARAFSLEGNGEVSDIDQASGYAQDAIKAVVANGIMTVYEGNFEPKDTVTKEMGITVMVRLSQ